MHELTERELYQALEYAKSLDENAGREIIAQFQLEQPALAQTIFGVFPNVIAEQEQGMSYLFLDLCFDVLCVFQKAFGPLPSQNDMDFDWLVKRVQEETAQLGLIDFMNAAIDDFASESPGRVPAIRITQTMIFIVVRLFSNLYSHAANK